MGNAAAILIKLDDSHSIKLYPDGKYSSFNWKSYRDLPTTKIEEVQITEFIGKDPSISIEKSLDGKKVVRIKETKRYRLKIGKRMKLPFFTDSEIEKLNICLDEDSFSFKFVNYIGRYTMFFPSCNKFVVFEVVPDKLNYIDDYRELTESIAHHCAALLLNHTSPTSLLFRQDINSYRTAFEQFVFLRQFCYSENIMALFEAIKRNPDRMLMSEESLKPIGLGTPSKKFYTHPFSYGKEWITYSNARKDENFYYPQKVAVTHKYDSVDTPANRLIKYALEKFDAICCNLLNSADNIDVAECIREADCMHQMLDNILHDNFFDDVGQLDVVPQNNQVLLKREGYSQIYSAFSMVDLALQLNWQGQEEVYKGETKDVALLYEYWLYFELYDIIKKLPNCKPLKTLKNPFISDKYGLTLSLSRSKEACQSFELEADGVKLNLYYNKTFSHSIFGSTRYEGSYSRPFRPDYTLAIFPKSYRDEECAIENGVVSYIHFDAKYRVDDITELIGKNNELPEYVSQELDAEKEASVVNTYKRGDLLKMHTYNDAIRRTIGSYVLYPGSIDKEDNRFRLYDDILPGVGAFAIRPSIQKDSEDTIRIFIMDFIRAKKQSSWRFYRLDHYYKMVVSEPRLENTLSKAITIEDDSCVLGYLKSDYYQHLFNSHKLNVGEEFLFYFYAIKEGKVYSHHKDIFNIRHIRFYKNDIQITKSYKLEPLQCYVDSCGLFSKEQLVSMLQDKEINYRTTVEQHHADYYFVLKVVVDNVNVSEIDLSVDQVNSMNGNDTYSLHSPKIISLLEDNQ